MLYVLPRKKSSISIICYIDIEILNLCICKTLMRKCLYEYKVS